MKQKLAKWLIWFVLFLVFLFVAFMITSEILPWTTFEDESFFWAISISSGIGVAGATFITSENVINSFERRMTRRRF